MQAQAAEVRVMQPASRARGLTDLCKTHDDDPQGDDVWGGNVMEVERRNSVSLYTLGLVFR